ncbi:outer membrane protein assembly factor BamD [Pseudomonadota bacterium]
MILFLGATLPSCTHKKKDPTAEEVYNNAMEYFMEGSYDFAGEQFEKIEDDFPFSEYATKSQVMSAYAYYKAKSYIDSLRIAEYYIQMYPNDESIEYMYYLRMMNYYSRVKSYKKSFEIARTTKLTLKELILKFPKSKYVDDVKIKLEEINNHLAASEMYVGRFYLNKKNYIGALDKFKLVVSESDYSRFHPEAYHRMVEVYTIIGLENEAKKSYDILKDKYQNTKWFKYSSKIIDRGTINLNND